MLVRKGKITKPALITLAAVSVAVVAGYALLMFVLPMMARSRAEAESFEVLSTAHTQQELQEAVGDLGLMISLKNGDWIAIRYRDKHSGMIWSSSVARDSGGAWFVSDFHFCGTFSAYRHAKERMFGLEQFSDIRAIDEAKDLETARRLLVELGFRPALPPTANSL